jgi:hypothetical protein
MRYMQLSEMLSMLRYEARLSANVAHGVQLADAHRYLLRRVQEELWLSFDWPHLKMNQTSSVNAGTRYTTYPNRVTFEGITGIETRDEANDWRLLVYGIEREHLNYKDSDANEQDFPVQRWQNYLANAAETINSNMLELWPIPDRNISLRFFGKRAIFPLVEDTHVSTIDGPLIVLHAAFELLQGQDAKDAQVKLQRAKDRERMLRLRQSASNNRPRNMAGSAAGTRLRPWIDYIPD